jgi:8-oxo-dGTP pyrophosphatase MutT (NUDIX family)
MRRSEAAVALIRRERDGRTLWLARWNPRWRAYHLVAGHRHADETFRDCLVREITEELGLREGADYSVAPGSTRRLEYTAWSVGAGAETRYTMELFDVELADDHARQRVDADAQNRWLSEAEIRSRQCLDGEAVSTTMELLLSKVGWGRA